MKRIVLISFIICSMYFYPKEALAQISVDYAVGVSAGLNRAPGIFGSARVHEAHTFWSLEAFMVVPWGAGMNLSLDLVRTKKLTIKMLDVGIFFPLIKKMSVPDVARNYDLVLGAGAVWHYNKKINFLLDWRAYLPDPTLIYYYGDFIRPIYKQAVKEGSLCIAISRLF